MKATMDPITISPQDVKNLVSWKQYLELIMMALLEIRNNRIRRGRTTDGRPLLAGGDKYTPGYEKRKREAGRKPYTSGDRLVYTGAMLGSQHIEAHVESMSGLLLFSPEDAPKAYGNNLRRMFIEFTRAEVERAIKAANRAARKSKK